MGINNFFNLILRKLNFLSAFFIVSHISENQNRMKFTCLREVSNLYFRLRYQFSKYLFVISCFFISSSSYYAIMLVKSLGQNLPCYVFLTVAVDVFFCPACYNLPVFICFIKAPIFLFKCKQILKLI